MGRRWRCCAAGLVAPVVGGSRAGAAQCGTLGRTGPLSPDPRGPRACLSHPGEHRGASPPGGFTGAGHRGAFRRLPHVSGPVAATVAAAVLLFGWSYGEIEYGWVKVAGMDRSDWANLILGGRSLVDPALTIGGAPPVGPDGRPVRVFSPGSANPPPFLAGRRKEKEKLREAVAGMIAARCGGTPMFLFGPRGMGKTVLLEDFENAPDCNADVRCITPSTELSDINNIPRVLLSTHDGWRGWRTALKNLREKIPHTVKVDVGICNVGYSFEGDMNDAGRAREIESEIILRCAHRPMVLIVDEAHMLTPDTGLFFLNYVQRIIKSGARLQLVLAGTPNLFDALGKIGASFIWRGNDVALGALRDEDAKDSIRIPLEQQKPKVSIDEDVLDRVVDRSQGYPYFLQILGEELWRGRKSNSMDNISMDVYASVEDNVNKRRADLYGKYLRDISPAQFFVPAALVAMAFQLRDAMYLEEARNIVFASTDPSKDFRSRSAYTDTIMSRLQAKDVLWEPDEGVVSPALPCFHRFILDRARQRVDARHLIAATINDRANDHIFGQDFRSAAESVLGSEYPSLRKEAPSPQDSSKAGRGEGR